jgi:hypothetical protein
VDRLPYVQVRALPFAVGWHPALRGGFKASCSAESGQCVELRRHGGAMT